MRTPKTPSCAKALGHLRQPLSVTTDARHVAWAQELLKRRNAVACWRGEAPISFREILHGLEALPAMQATTLT